MVVYVLEAPEGTDSVWTTHDAAAERLKVLASEEIEFALEEERYINRISAYGNMGEYYPKDGEYAFPDVPIDDLMGAAVESGYETSEWHITEREVQE